MATTEYQFLCPSVAETALTGSLGIASRDVRGKHYVISGYIRTSGDGVGYSLTIDGAQPAKVDRSAASLFKACKGMFETLAADHARRMAKAS